MKRRLLMPVVFLAAAAILAAIVFDIPGCGSSDQESPILLIGLDGLESSIVREMVARGKLPNIAALIDSGVCGHIQTIAPALSPVVWTTVATGKAPRSHGIMNFTDRASGGAYTSNARRGKALWNITGDYGKTCNVVGYWITWPAEEINGVVVSQISSKSQGELQKQKKGMLFREIEGITHPAGFIEEIWPFVEKANTPDALYETVVKPVFGDVNAMEPAPSDEVRELITSSYWSFATDKAYFAAGRHLFEKSPADLNIIYFGGTDVVGHRFWRYMEPEAFSYPVAQAEIDAFGDSIERYYKLADDMIGELMAIFPGGTRIIVMSDHGMHADYLNGKKPNGTKAAFSAHHLDGPPGMFIAKGPGIRKGGGVEGFLEARKIEKIATIFDVAPTLLYLLDIPVGRDMRVGKVLKGILEADLLEARPVKYLDTHDEGFRLPTPSRSSAEADREFIERMKSLGYLGDDSDTEDFRLGPLDNR